MLNQSLQTTLRYVGFGAVAGAGSLFYLAKRYQRKWALPAFAGGVSGTFLGQYAGAMSFASHFKQEGRDPRVVLSTLARISRESDVKRAESAAGGAGENRDGLRGARRGVGALPVEATRSTDSSSQSSSRWDQLRSGATGAHGAAATQPPSSPTQFNDANFPRASEDFEYVQDSDRSQYRSSAEKDL